MRTKHIPGDPDLSIWDLAVLERLVERELSEQPDGSSVYKLSLDSLRKRLELALVEHGETAPSDLR